VLTPADFSNDQRRVIPWLQAHEEAILWADCGVGKTVSILTALLGLINGFESRRILVVGPRLVVERVWSAEVEQWSHLNGLKVVRVVGTPAQRLRALATPADIHCISRDNVEWLESLYIHIIGVDAKGKPVRAQYKKWDFDTVVLDESQSFKSQSSKRYKSMRRLRRLFQRIYLLSGSLMPNGYKDLWSQVYLVDGGARLGTSEEAYHRRWFSKEVNDGVVTFSLLPGADKEIDKAISDVCLVMRDMQPAVPKNFIRVSLSKEEQKTYSKMARSNVIELGGKQINAINAGVLWGKLLQLANGAVYDADKVYHVLHDRKLEALGELLESLPRPVIVGYGFVHDVERLQRFLSKTLPGERIGILRTGKSLDVWRSGGLDIGIMHPASAGHGLNDLYVSGAENLVWFGFTSNREFYDQLNGRLAGGHRRTGRKICIHHIIADNTIDEDALAMLDFKGDQQSTAQIRVAQRYVKEST
jgi:SNF2 family DNA or RNA helicase